MPEMNINGMTNVNDTINMIKDTIDAGYPEGAKEYLDQLKDVVLVDEEEEDNNTMELSEDEEKIAEEWDKVRVQLRKNIGKNIIILKKFDTQYDTNLGQWYDNETDTLDENLDDEFQMEV